MSPSQPPAEPTTRARLIAFYLPQFHPIPENNAWWGKGFTEWTNVVPARPQFSGHHQPHIPADLGFYDLRLPEARTAQDWHYWFHGKRLLERPFDEVRALGSPDLPFCLAWANESWSRRWLGEPRDILIRQTYSPDDDLNHARWLAGVFSDARHIRVRGRPLFLVYRPLDLPEPRRTTDTVRAECGKRGLPEPYLIGINAHCTHIDCRTLGFDGTLNFEPQLGVLPDFADDGPRPSKLLRNRRLGVPSDKLKIYEHAEARSLVQHERGWPVVPSIFVGWDNTPRRGADAIILVNSRPELFERGLRDFIDKASDQPYDERLVFINAWNEWAEGNHLEPDQMNGRGFLEAARRANDVTG